MSQGRRSRALAVRLYQQHRRCEQTKDTLLAVRI